MAAKSASGWMVMIGAVLFDARIEYRLPSRFKKSSRCYACQRSALRKTCSRGENRRDLRLNGHHRIPPERRGSL
jgi:hypothetical protein